jgi:hypothetical protein
MSHFAEIDENNIVVRVLVGDNALPNEGLDWFIENLGGRWIQTSYNGNFRKQFAAIGYTYNPEADVFIENQTYPSWILDENFDWQPPTPKPTDGEYYWREETTSWVKLELDEV